MSSKSRSIRTEFQSVRLLPNLPYKVSVVPDGTASSESGETIVQNEDGTFTIYLKQSFDPARHVALGKFLDEWSKLELSLRFLMTLVFRVPFNATSILSNSLGARGIIDSVGVLGSYRLSENEQRRLTDLLDRFKTNNTRRNHIIHGLWVLEVIISDANGFPRLFYNPVREYKSSDPLHDEKSRDRSNKKFRDNYIFSIRRIHSIRVEVSRLNRDISDFHRDVLERTGQLAADQSRDRTPNP